MYAVSQDYLLAMKKPVQRSRMTGRIGTIPFVDQNILKGSFSISHQCSGNEEVQIGQVYMAELNVTFMKNMHIPRYSLKDKVIKPYHGLMLANRRYEDIPLGVFNVNEAEWTSSGVVIKAYDNMIKLDKACTVNSAIGLPYQLATMACDYCGLTLGTTETEFSFFVNGSTILSMLTENDIETWRDFISWVAQTVGCNVMADREGKIIFKAYNQTVVDTIDETHRFKGCAFSDFTTRYTGISCVNIAEKTTSYYGLEVDDGLTYNLGSNPFLQYGVEEAKAGQRRAVLSALQQINYVPFTADMIGFPVYDLMDVFSFPGGLGDEDKLFCMTKYVFNYHGKYSMTGVGKNPALANAKSKTDKNIVGLLSQKEHEGMQYTVFNNVEPVVVADGESKSVMLIRFIVEKKTHCQIEMEILVDVETTEEGEEGAWIENDAVCTVTYYLNGEEIEQRVPVETWQDGRHILSLHYDLQAVAAQIHEWDVWLTMAGGQVSMGKYDILGVIAGEGLAGDSEWDGIIRAEDNVHPIHFYPMFRGVQDSAELSTHVPAKATSQDRLHVLNFMGMFKRIRDSVTATGDVMVFTPYVNQGRVVTRCTYNNTVGWIGDGSAVGGDALDVVTVPVTGVTKVEAYCSNAVFYASFDGGSHWLAYSATNRAWIEGASMTDTELAVVPASAWAYGTSVQIRAVLEVNASLYSIDCYGGKVG